MRSAGVCMRHAASMTVQSRGLSTEKGRSARKSCKHQQDSQKHDFGEAPHIQLTSVYIILAISVVMQVTEQSL